MTCRKQSFKSIWFLNLFITFQNLYSIILFSFFKSLKLHKNCFHQEQKKGIMKLALLKVLNAQKAINKQFPQVIKERKDLFEGVKLMLRQDQFFLAPRDLQLSRNHCFMVSSWKASLWSICGQSWFHSYSGEEICRADSFTGSPFCCDHQLHFLWNHHWSDIASPEVPKCIVENLEYDC